jgi:RNA polymerase sigma-70 factor, ECF subfamily
VNNPGWSFSQHHVGISLIDFAGLFGDTLIVLRPIPIGGDFRSLADFESLGRPGPVNQWCTRMSEQWLPPPDFEELVAAARVGSSDAMGKLLDAYRSYLLLIANQELRLRGPAKVTASDVVQDTFLEAHRDFAAFGGGSAPTFRGWLRQMLLHNLADAYRRYEGTAKGPANREANLSASATYEVLSRVAAQDPTPSQVATERESDARLEQALQTLPDDYRAAILMRYREGLSFEEIADRMDRSVDAVRKLWLRGVKRLQAVLAAEGDSESFRTA